MKDMMHPSILSTHTPPSEVTCWFYSPKLLKKCQNYDFRNDPFWRCFLGVKISKTQNKVGMSQNRQNLDFEIIPLGPSESSGEQPPTIKKMFRGREGVEKSIFLNPDFGCNSDFERKWKSTLQRMTCISKLGFWQKIQDPHGDPKKKYFGRSEFF